MHFWSVLTKFFENKGIKTFKKISASIEKVSCLCLYATFYYFDFMVNYVWVAHLNRRNTLIEEAYVEAYSKCSWIVRFVMIHWFFFFFFFFFFFVYRQSEGRWRCSQQQTRGQGKLSIWNGNQDNVIHQTPTALSGGGQGARGHLGDNISHSKV